MKYLNTLIFLIIIGCSSSSKMMIGKEAEFLTGDQIENLKLTAELDKLISIEKYRLINIYLRNLNYPKQVYLSLRIRDNNDF